MDAIKRDFYQVKTCNILTKTRSIFICSHKELHLNWLTISAQLNDDAARFCSRLAQPRWLRMPFLLKESRRWQQLIRLNAYFKWIPIYQNTPHRNKRASKRSMQQSQESSAKKSYTSGERLLFTLLEPAGFPAARGGAPAPEPQFSI